MDRTAEIRETLANCRQTLTTWRDSGVGRDHAHMGFVMFMLRDMAANAPDAQDRREAADLIAMAEALPAYGNLVSCLRVSPRRL